MNNLEKLKIVAAENRLRLSHGREFRAALTIMKKDLIIKKLINKITN